MLILGEDRVERLLMANNGDPRRPLTVTRALPWPHNPAMKAMSIDSIVDLLQALVRTPSRAGEDDLDPICALIGQWLAERKLSVRELFSESGRRVGVYAQIRGQAPGRWTILDATLDTAGFGDPTTWSCGPTDARIEGGWLWGRGAADSKAAVALFSELLSCMSHERRFAGRIGVLFDCDEHSGAFGGARAFFDHPDESGMAPRPDGVFIGYPGMDRIIVGCRGFVRARLRVHGVAAHSGSSRSQGVNAVSRAVALCQQLERWSLPGPDEAFPLPPKLTLTGLKGGSESFTQVPDACEVRVDIRLTPRFTDEHAHKALAESVSALDAAFPAVAPTDVDWIPGWPAYRLRPNHPLARALRDASRDELGTEVPTAVVGPSNIGNYLASLGVPALCGFGVRFEGIHAADERIDLDSLEPVYRIYRAALRTLHQL